MCLQIGMRRIRILFLFLSTIVATIRGNKKVIICVKHPLRISSNVLCCCKPLMVMLYAIVVDSSNKDEGKYTK